MTPECRRLHTEAMAAYAVAYEAFEDDPQPGTPEWDRWIELRRAAMNANDAYIRELGVHRLDFLSQRIAQLIKNRNARRG